MMNWLLVALLLLALVGIGALAMIIDSGVEDKQKATLVYGLFGLFGLIGVVFMLVEDKSAFVNGDWASSEKKGGKKAKQHGEAADGEDGEQAEAEVARKSADSSADSGDGNGAGSQGDKGPELEDGRDCDACPQMVPVDGGATVVGTLFREAGQGGPILGPLQEAKLPGYSIGRYEITVAQFEAFLKEKGHKPASGCRAGKEIREGATFRSPGFDQSPEHPVVCISWYDAVAYADWLTQKTRRKYDLATEVEWESAARSGSLDSYATGKQIHGAQAQFRTVGPTRKGTAAIGMFGATKLGLYDVHGNAAEMIRNCWNTSEKATDATTGECEARTIKGGSWSSTAGHLQFAARAPIGINEADNTVGFRVVRRRE
ncbi:MAG: SUMF1/EgtB/PvdO family nonheme iron enzyme [Hyphomicrobium sp.]